jgi:hypothetical protein
VIGDAWHSRAVVIQTHLTGNVSLLLASHVVPSAQWGYLKVSFLLLRGWFFVLSNAGDCCSNSTRLNGIILACHVASLAWTICILGSSGALALCPVVNPSYLASIGKRGK